MPDAAEDAYRAFERVLSGAYITRIKVPHPRCETSKHHGVQQTLPVPVGIRGGGAIERFIVFGGGCTEVARWHGGVGARGCETAGYGGRVVGECKMQLLGASLWA